jgi:prophage regulatory protein
MRTQSTQQHTAPAFAGATMPAASASCYLPFVYFPIKAVCQSVGLSTSRIYELIRLGEFPAGDLIGAQSRRWKSTDIAAWLNKQAEQAAQREAELAAPLKRKADMAARKSSASRAAARGADHAAA